MDRLNTDSNFNNEKAKPSAFNVIYARQISHLGMIQGNSGHYKKGRLKTTKEDLFMLINEASFKPRDLQIREEREIPYALNKKVLPLLIPNRYHDTFVNDFLSKHLHLNYVTFTHLVEVLLVKLTLQEKKRKKKTLLPSDVSPEIYENVKGSLRNYLKAFVDSQHVQEGEKQ